MNSSQEILYVPVPGTDIIKLITNPNKIDPHLIHTSRHPALISTRKYLQYILDTNACPFVTAIHNNNHYHALLYDNGGKNHLDYETFYNKLGSSFLQICDKEPSENRPGSVNTILLGILTDPDKANHTFGDQVEKQYLKRRDEVIKSGHMSAVVHSNRRPGSVSTKTNHEEEKKDLFKVDGVPFIMYKLLQTYDAGFMRTPSNISAFKGFFPNTSQRYLDHFKKYLQQKIVEDKKYVSELEEGKQSIDDILIYFYEHYLKDAPIHCEIGLREMLKIDFDGAKKTLLSYIEKKSDIYNAYIESI